MRFRGGGVRHKSTQQATDWFLSDHDKLDEGGGTDTEDEFNNGMNDMEIQGELSDAEMEDTENEGNRIRKFSYLVINDFVTFVDEGKRWWGHNAQDILPNRLVNKKVLFVWWSFQACDDLCRLERGRPAILCAISLIPFHALDILSLYLTVVFVLQFRMWFCFVRMSP